VAGHSPECPDYKPNDKVQKSSRGKLYDSTAILWYQSKGTNFYTFTLPSLENGVYQKSVTCEETGDIAIGKKFSKVLEAWSKRVRRKNKRNKLSYVWVAEAQSERQQKFGGVGDIHYHLITNQLVKNSRGVSDLGTLQWLQSLWCEHVGVEANNCVHVDYVPPSVRSMPAYMSKYMGKGSQRKIISRSFQCSRDLSNFKPITISSLPELTLTSKKDLVFESGYEMTAYYFNTTEVLEMYAEDFHHEALLSAQRQSEVKTAARIRREFISRQNRKGRLLDLFPKPVA
jgi:hypothetical protein